MTTQSELLWCIWALHSYFNVLTTCFVPSINFQIHYPYQNRSWRPTDLNEGTSSQILGLSLFSANSSADLSTLVLMFSKAGAPYEGRIISITQKTQLNFQMYLLSTHMIWPIPHYLWPAIWYCVSFGCLDSFMKSTILFMQACAFEIIPRDACRQNRGTCRVADYNSQHFNAWPVKPRFKR